MTKLILEKSKHFDVAGGRTREALEEILGKEFSSVSELTAKLPPSVFLPKKEYVEIDTLPFVIKAWPVYFSKDPPYGTYEVAKVKVI